ncbi:MAG: hypothetical protein Q7R73_02720 [bacterium]|nr:hypothetical protein [bacterium]
MLVEIQGVDYEKMETLPPILERVGLKNWRKIRGPLYLYKINGDTGGVKKPIEVWENVFENEDKTLRVLLRHPGELCVTIEGSREWIYSLLSDFGIPAIPFFRCAWPQQ